MSFFQISEEINLFSLYIKLIQYIYIDNLCAYFPLCIIVQNNQGHPLLLLEQVQSRSSG